MSMSTGEIFVRTERETETQRLITFWTGMTVLKCHQQHYCSKYSKCLNCRFVLIQLKLSTFSLYTQNIWTSINKLSLRIIIITFPFSFHAFDDRYEHDNHIRYLQGGRNKENPQQHCIMYNGLKTFTFSVFIFVLENLVYIHRLHDCSEADG